MTAQNPQHVAATYFDALSRGDVPAAMSMLSPDVVWHQPGAHQFSGDHEGLDGVGALLGGMMEASGGTFQLVVTGAPMVNGDMVAVPVRFSGARPGTTMDMSGVDLLSVRDGMIATVHLFSEDGTAEDSFWGQA